MKQEIVIITGANSGIGKAAALRFANEGYTVIMACRNIAKSKTAQNEIVEASNNNNVHLKALDLSSFDSIRSFCSDFKAQFHKLDILIHNAAYFNHGEPYRLSVENIELTFATNVVGPFYMTELLLPHLKESANPRILNASSNIVKHFFSPKKVLDFDNLLGVADPHYKHSVYTSYRNSKMALLMLTFKMAEVYDELGIRVNSIQINGARMSKETLGKFKSKWRLIAMVQNLFFPPTTFMADKYYTICTADQFRHTTGKYFNHKPEIMLTGPENPKPKDIFGTKYYPLYADNKEVRDRIWKFCQELTNGSLNE